MLIGQIVSDFEEKTVINETTVNKAGRKEALHLPFSERRETISQTNLLLAALKQLLERGTTGLLRRGPGTKGMETVHRRISHSLSSVEIMDKSPWVHLR